MSETTSSPSVHVHSMSPSSSFSSADSAPHSEPTSDEQPDLGAFTTVLREWTHLQPPPRIPVQIHSATSSTTSTYQPEQSTVGSDRFDRSQRSRYSRLSGRTGTSGVSSFTRPPSSSAHPEGSTVWNQAPIASYLYSQTPSNDIEEEEEDASRDELVTPSSPHSALTVEIASEVEFPSFAGSSEHLPDQPMELPVPVGSDGQRLDSRETARPEEDLMAEDAGESSSLTSREHVRPQSDVSSLGETQSMGLQSQVGAPTNASSDSLFIPPLPSTIATAIPTISSLSLHSNNHNAANSSSTSTSTLTTAMRNTRSRPIGSRSTSDSSYVTNESASSSNFSLLSYQIPETPPESDQERGPAYTATTTTTSTVSSLGSLVTQQSLHTSAYISSGHSNSFQQAPENIVQTSLPPSDVSRDSSVSSNTFPLPNPYSPSLSVLSRGMQTEDNTRRAPRPTLAPGWQPSQMREVVNDFTPERTPHEPFITEPQNHNMDFVFVDDNDNDNDSDRDSVEAQRLSITNNHASRRADDAATKTVDVKQVADYSSNNARAGPSAQHLPPAERNPYTEPQGAEGGDDEIYSHRYPNAYTPKLYAQAITPKGIPPATESNTKTMTHTELSSRLPLGGIDNHPRQEHPNEQASRLMSSSNLQSKYDSHSRSNIMTQSSGQAPAAEAHTRQPSLYPNTQSTSTSRPHISTQSTSIHTDPPVMPIHHTYPHSLLGLHALPASLVSPDAEDVPGFDFNRELGSSINVEEIADYGDFPEPLVVENDSTSDVLDFENGVNPEIPSLGYLDEALSFIAAERERWTASREGTTQTILGTLNHDPLGAGSGEEGEGAEGEAEWKRLDNEQDQQDQEQEQPKRRRRRKRPPRTHVTALAPAGNEHDQISSSVGEQISTSSAGPSPKKKRRSKSVPASAAATEGKLKARIPEKTFLVPPPATPAVTILRRPVDTQAKGQAPAPEDAAFDSENDGAKTPTNGVARLQSNMVIQSSDDSPINLLGKKGKRVGRKEREREKLKKDMEKERMKASDPEKRSVDDDDIGFEFEHDEEGDDDDGFDAEEIEEDEDEHGENDSISNMSLLQPPRRKGLQRHKKPADIHSVIGIGESGTYKSMPGSPKLQFDGEKAVDVEHSAGGNLSPNVEGLGGDDVFDSQPTGLVVGEKKKRARSKRVKSLLHAKSDPQLRLDANVTGDRTVGDDLPEPSSVKSKKGKKKSVQHDEDEDILDMDRTQFQKLILESSATGSRLVLLNQKRKAEAPVQSAPPNSKRGRVIALARRLIQLFPEQQEELGKVIARLERQDSGKTLTSDSNVGGGLLHKSAPISIPGVKRTKSKKGSHTRTASEGTGGEGMDFGDDSIDSGVGGLLPGIRQLAGMIKEDEDEIDPRGRPPKKGDVLIHVFIDHSNILIGFLSHLKRHPPERKLVGNITRSRPLPAVLTKTATSMASNDISDPMSAFSAVKSTGVRPLLISSKSEATSQATSHPIPLPSFATTSRSLPASGGLTSYMAERHGGRSSDSQDNKDVDSDGKDYADEGADVVRSDTLFSGSLQRVKEQKLLRHLWHAALTLILERGRPVTRRVVVTSSPLYQPMDAIERLGYELRVFIRVPDFGDGMDRERLREKHGSGKSNLSSSKSAQHTSPTAGMGINVSPQKGSTVGHTRKLSGNISAESGSGEGSGNGSGGGTGKGTNNSNTTPNTKIKYREQGVDELLQLKLHQALAATDYVPEGSTIVLATGDGNVGQFNEDGFLGPVRTALRRGWKVELYAWEDGLSRSWRREFGSSSEWGRRGMFRVIGMEQFANSLLEASELLT